MKKIAVLAAVAMLAGTMNWAVSADAQTIDNGWTVTYLNQQQDDTHYAEFTNTQSRSGDYSLHLKYAEGVTTGQKFSITHPAQRTFTEWDAANQFRVQFYIKGQYDKWGLQIGTFDYDADAAGGTRQRLTNAKVNFGEVDENGWAKVYFDFYYPYDATKSQFQIHVYGGPLDAYIDDVSVTYNGTLASRNGYNLLSDGGFEPIPVATGEALSNYGWSMTDSSGSAVAEIAEDHNGDKMLHFRYDTRTYDDKVVLYRTIKTPNGAGGIDWAEYRIYFKAKGSFLPGSIEIGNDQTDSQLRKLNDAANVTTKEMENGWTQYCVTTKGQNSAAKNSFRMKIHGYAHDLLLDDFMVVKLDANKNEISGDHLVNGTFDNPSQASGTTASNWYPAAGNANGGDPTFLVSKNSIHTYTGKNAMFISAAGVWVDQKYIDFRQTLPEDFDYTKNYTFKVKVYTPSPNTGLNVTFCNTQNVSTANKKLDTQNAEVVDLGSGWYEYTLTLTPQAGYNHLRILAMSLTGGVWVDDVSLTGTDGKEYIKNGSFEKYNKTTIGAFALLDESYEDIDALVAGDNTLTINVKSLEAGLDYNLYFAIYKNGDLYDVMKTHLTDAPVGSAQELEATINLESVTDGVYTAKAFLWDDEMVSYIPAEEF